MQVMSFIGGLTCGYLSDRYRGGRGLLATWWTLGAVAVFTLVFFNDHVINVTCTAAAGFFIIGAMFVLNNFTAASYETGARATAVGMELGVGRVGAILGPFVAGTLQQTYQSPTAMFVAIGVAAMAAALAVLCAQQPRSITLPGVAAPAVLADAG
jgi:sugar phosphate permease